MSGSIKERMKRIEIFHADKKHRLIRRDLGEPEIEFASLIEIDNRFREMCDKQSVSLFPIESKQDVPAAAALEVPISRTQKQTYSSIHLTNPHRQRITSPSNRNHPSLHQNSRGQQEDTSQIHLATSPSPLNRIPTHYSSFKPEDKQVHKSMNSLEQYKVNKKRIVPNKSYLSPGSLKQAQQQQQPVSKINNEIPKLQSAQAAAAKRFASPPFFKAKPAATDLRLSVGIDLMKSKNSAVRFGHTKNINQSTQALKTQDSADFQIVGIEERMIQSPEWQLIQKRIKEQMKVNKIDENSDKFLNPIVKLFGNNFIAMVMQALIVKKIDDVYGVKFNTDSNIPISENLLRQFGISTQMLNNIASPVDRNNYIADTMALRITMMVKEWDEKQSKRFMRLEQVIEQDQKEQDRKAELHSDLFDWLKVGTHHEMLKKKLRMAIIEKLSDVTFIKHISGCCHAYLNGRST